MILVDTSASGNVDFKFLPRTYPVQDTGRGTVVVTDEQTKDVYTYTDVLLKKCKYFLRATISREDFVADRRYTYTVTYDTQEIARGKILAFDFSVKGFTAGQNDKLNDKDGEFTERSTTNNFIVI